MKKACLQFVMKKRSYNTTHDISSILGLKRVLYKKIRKAKSIHNLKGFNLNITNSALTDKDLRNFIDSFCEDKFNEIKKK